ncbi:MAG: peptide chain release factor N(5)-glutamine methyltransferase [gamma proteobacterium symbiont of Bathyaustriella thionipta]|nr:peptide chain release factor N(5)-glutamine methyltransferase [gamma proteobacterium symbiont of Bathyaustriella thionipta]
MPTESDLQTPSIAQLLAQATRVLSDRPDIQPRFESELLLAHVLKVNRSHLFAFPEKKPATRQSGHFLQLVEQRRAGQPIAYLTGQRDFHAIQLQINADVLIPRADTELLVDTAIDLLENRPQARILDLGTGSGAVALALAHALPQAHISATDISQPALQIAEQNRQALKLPPVHFFQGNWFTALPAETARFDMIVSNPPYIARHDLHLQQGDLRFEPQQALVSGKDGLQDIRIIIEQAATWLRPNGCLLLEHGYQQADALKQLFKQHGYRAINNLRDLNQQARVTLAQI